MAMSLSLFSNWGIGILNGYKYKEDGISNKIKYTAMSVSSLLFGTRVIFEENIQKIPPKYLFTIFLVIAPLVIGSSFCVGTQFGKAIRDAEDNRISDKN
jgi:branched-subunit amino acid ABC-type transport system permease component